MTFVIIHADDLGLSRGFDQGILAAATEGILTSTSIRVNGASYRRAIDETVPQLARIGIGLHLNIVEGSTLRSSDRKSVLCDERGRFCLHFGAIWKRRRDPALLAEVEAEYRNQIEIALRDIKRLDHLNSHQHTHGIPEIFEIVAKLAAEYRIPFVRLPVEQPYLAPPLWRHLRPWYLLNLVKLAIINPFAARNRAQAKRYGVRTNDRFVGILYTGHMTEDTIIKGLRRAAQRADIVEILLHPTCILGIRDERFLCTSVRDYVIDSARTTELKALTSPEILTELRAAGYKPTSYTALVDGTARHYAAHVFEAAEAAQMKNQTPSQTPLKTYFILDETPLHQPGYFRRLVEECADIECCAVAIVELPRGGLLQRYLLMRWRDLGVRELTLLAGKQLLLKLAGIAPKFLRGDFNASVRAVAKRLQIPYKVVSTVNTSEFLDHVRQLAPDLIISSNSLIFKDCLLKLPKLGCINRHSAPLPSYGGILPVFRAVQKGEQFTGASVHIMSRGIDEGDVLSRKWLPIFPGDTLNRLYALCFVLSHEATVEAVSRLRWGRPSASIDLEGIERSYFSYPEDKDWREFRARGGRFI